MCINLETYAVKLIQLSRGIVDLAAISNKWVKNSERRDVSKLLQTCNLCAQK